MQTNNISKKLKVFSFSRKTVGTVYFWIQWCNFNIGFGWWRNPGVISCYYGKCQNVLFVFPRKKIVWSLQSHRNDDALTTGLFYYFIIFTIVYYCGFFNGMTLITYHSCENHWKASNILYKMAIVVIYWNYYPDVLVGVNRFIVIINTILE